jgi:hypothetical protein
LDKIFEVRILKRFVDRWAFGAYTPTATGPCAQNLKLRVDLDDPRFVNGDMDTRLLHIVDKSYGPLTLRYRPMDSKQCAFCHNEMGSVGPCHFGDEQYSKFPDLQVNTLVWVEQFQKRFGHSPFH